jgi:hypothetical protein
MQALFNTKYAYNRLLNSIKLKGKKGKIIQ